MAQFHGATQVVVPEDDSRNTRMCIARNQRTLWFRPAPPGSGASPRHTQDTASRPSIRIQQQAASVPVPKFGAPCPLCSMVADEGGSEHAGRLQTADDWNWR